MDFGLSFGHVGFGIVAVSKGDSVALFGRLAVGLGNGVCFTGGRSQLTGTVAPFWNPNMRGGRRDGTHVTSRSVEPPSRP